MDRGERRGLCANENRSVRAQEARERKIEERHRERLDRLETIIYGQHEKLDRLEDLVYRVMHRDRVGIERSPRYEISPEIASASISSQSSLETLTSHPKPDTVLREHQNLGQDYIKE